EEQLAPHAGKASADELDAARRALTKKRLNDLVDMKLVLADAYRKIPPDNRTKLETHVNEQFNKTQLKSMMESLHAGSKTELETKLRKLGTSLETQRRAYFERSVASQWIFQQV